MMDYKVVRTGRKALALMVRKNGELEVRAPLHTTEEHIAAFVQAHEDWARKHVARVLDSPPPQTEEDIAALVGKALAAKVKSALSCRGAKAGESGRES